MPLKIRDIILALGGGFILYHEVVVSATAEPLLVFAAFFLLGLIPATRADEPNGGSFLKSILRNWLNDDA